MKAFLICNLTDLILSLLQLEKRRPIESEAKFDSSLEVIAIVSIRRRTSVMRSVMRSFIRLLRPSNAFSTFKK